MNAGGVSKAGSEIGANVGPEEVVHILRASYGMTVNALKQLEGYDDRNYHVKVLNDVDNPFVTHVCADGYVLKIMNSLDSKNESFVRGQHELMEFLDEKGIKVPLPVKNVKGEKYSVQKFQTDGHIVRLLTFIPGEVLVNTAPSSEMLCNIGEFIGKLSILLKGLKLEGYNNRNSIWMLENVLSIKPFLKYVQNEKKLEIINKTLDEFERSVLPILKSLEKGIIHGDINQHNLIVSGNEVAALLDFGDSHYSAFIFDLAISICYMILHSKDVEEGIHVIEGYLRIRQISEQEKYILKVSISARLCQSLVMGVYSIKQDPANSYILSSQQEGWSILLQLHDLTNDQLLHKWRLK